MQYSDDTRSLTDAHTWRRVRLAEWLDEMQCPSRGHKRRPPRRKASPLPGYIFDQSGAAGTTALGPSIHRLFPWRALFHSFRPGLYVGGNGSGNPFHYHQQTWNALVAGTKRWFLYPPNASFYSELHPREWLRRRRHLPASGSDTGGWSTADTAGAPLVCEQHPGDVLFVPKLWGHGTLNMGETVGVAVPFSLRQGVDYVGALSHN